MTISIWWVTRDLRLDDNPALVAAAQSGAVLPVFVLDDQTRPQGAASRWRLQRGLQALDATLRKQHGGGLTILEGAPEEQLPRLAAQVEASAIHQTDWPCPEMTAVQERLRQALKGKPVTLHLHPGHLLTIPGAIRTGSGGSYRVFTPFARALRAHGPDRPVNAPKALKLADAPGGFDSAALDLAPDMRGGADVLARHALPAGEDQAFARLHMFLDNAKGYGPDRDRPDRDSTSGLSEHLAVGEISPRRIWAEALPHLDGAAGDDVAKFLSELCWRDFAWHLLIEFPQMAAQPWRAEWREFPWQGRGAGLTAWCQARTGIALVDAGLREMRVTGRMHNRVRMVVASWLTKNLMTDWRLGLAHFQDSLTDWDPASNAMNWQWVAGCGPDASPFFRIFNPERQAEQFDAKGQYRRRWLLGFEGADGDEAQAYFDAIPPGWPVPRRWQPQSGALAETRDRALDAYRAFKSDAGSS